MSLVHAGPETLSDKRDPDSEWFESGPAFSTYTMPAKNAINEFNVLLDHAKNDNIQSYMAVATLKNGDQIATWEVEDFGVIGAFEYAKKRALEDVTSSAVLKLNNEDYDQDRDGQAASEVEASQS